MENEALVSLKGNTIQIDFFILVFFFFFFKAGFFFIKWINLALLLASA